MNIFIFYLTRYLAGRGRTKRHTLAMTIPGGELADEVNIKLMQQPLRRRGILASHERSPRKYYETDVSNSYYYTNYVHV